MQSGVPPITPNIVFCCLVIVVAITTNTQMNCDIKGLFTKRDVKTAE